MSQQHQLKLNFLHDRTELLIPGLDADEFKQVLLGLCPRLRIFVLPTCNLVILIYLLVILTIIDIRVESMNLTGAINHVLVEFMNARALMHL